MTINVDDHRGNARIAIKKKKNSNMVIRDMIRV
jgi:hypothetical protein